MEREERRFSVYVAAIYIFSENISCSVKGSQVEILYFPIFREENVFAPVSLQPTPATPPPPQCLRPCFPKGLTRLTGNI